MAGAKSDLAYLLAANNQNLDRALRLAEEARRSMSTDPKAVGSVGYVYLRKGLYEAALQQFRTAIELDDGSSFHIPMIDYDDHLSIEGLKEECRRIQRKWKWSDASIFETSFEN